LVERTPEEEERYQASLVASELLRPDSHDLTPGQFAQVGVDLQFASSVLQARLVDETDPDQKARLQHAIGTLEALIEKTR
jgi:hypothetical protein